jgi:hypothetical protein
MTELTDAQLVELSKNPEFRAEIAIRQAKTPVHGMALIAEAIREAVKQDRVLLRRSRRRVGAAVLRVPGGRSDPWLSQCQTREVDSNP